MESRKVAKMHQNILVFFKGDPTNIRTEFPAIELDEAEKNALSDIIENYQPKEDLDDAVSE